MNGILTDTTIPSLSEPGSNGNAGIFHTPQVSSSEPYHYIQFGVIPRPPFS